jgi:hypothetical protein
MGEILGEVRIDGSGADTVPEAGPRDNDGCGQNWASGPGPGAGGFQPLSRGQGVSAT